MTFVSGYDQDVFISYAHVDNEPFFDATKADGPTGWVATFFRLLKIELAQKLGRAEDFTVWFDAINLRGNHSVTPEITTKLGRAATFVAILSPPYAASRWCRDEARIFTQHFAGDLAGRVFVVEKEPLDDRPPELTGPLGYRFWYRDRNEQPRTLGKPMPQPDEIQYFRQIEDLARDIHRQLKAMAGRQPDRGPSPSGGAVNGGSAAAATFLAEVTDDLDFRRLELKRYLEQRGALVLPEKSFPLGRAEFEAALDADLARSLLFVQLLGPAPGKLPPDVPEGYGWLQLDCARRRGLRVLQWRSPEVDLSGIQWPRHRELLELETVQASSLETFKNAVAVALAPPPPAPPPRSTGDQPLVFLNIEPRHREIATKIREAIRDRAALVEPLRDGSAEEIRVDFEQNLIECDAMIMVYSDNAGWARAQLRAFRKQAPRREHPVRAIPVIDAPADPKPELGFYLPGMVLIDCRNGIGSGNLAELLRELRL
jgi:hypothetical protein